MTPQASVQTRVRRRMPWLVGITVGVLILIVLAFAVGRLVVDVSNLAAGTMPNDEYDARFVRHPWLSAHRAGCAVHGRRHLAARLLVPQVSLHIPPSARPSPACGRPHHRAPCSGSRLGVSLRRSSRTFCDGPIRGLVPWLSVACIPCRPGGRHRAAPALDDPRIRDRRRGRHDPHLDSGVPDQRAAQLLSSFRSGVLDLLHAARSHRRALAARSPAATGSDTPCVNLMLRG
jgi:hypothetical protein